MLTNAEKASFGELSTMYSMIILSEIILIASNCDHRVPKSAVACRRVLLEPSEPCEKGAGHSDQFVGAKIRQGVQQGVSPALSQPEGPARIA